MKTLNFPTYNIQVEIYPKIIKIIDSYKISKYSDMKVILMQLIDNNELPENYNRSLSGMIEEWRCHNLFYKLGIYKNRTKDCDLEYPQKWYYKIAYFLMSPFYFNFK